tara:strand:- start:87 stop:407 length:321 start_codon:yes stop_codon:yes gene_type:complete
MSNYDQAYTAGFIAGIKYAEEQSKKEKEVVEAEVVQAEPSHSEIVLQYITYTGDKNDFLSRKEVKNILPITAHKYHRVFQENNILFSKRLIDGVRVCGYSGICILK